MPGEFHNAVAMESLKKAGVDLVDHRFPATTEFESSYCSFLGMVTWGRSVGG